MAAFMVVGPSIGHAQTPAADLSATPRTQPVALPPPGERLAAAPMTSVATAASSPDGRRSPDDEKSTTTVAPSGLMMVFAGLLVAAFLSRQRGHRDD